ncbi:four helix bundle protein [Candidatus Uhrbacteria bacterium]|nr:four helix bundle protein [Candidatus Uhrbacteria bacterium]
MRTLQLIEGIWEANSLPIPERLVLLDRLQRTLDLVKILVRLTYDLGIYKREGYIYRENQLMEIGRMLGGWRKKTRGRLGLVS